MSTENNFHCSDTVVDWMLFSSLIKNNNICPFSFPGKRYDERVDIFSFGIMLCEVSDPPHCRNKNLIRYLGFQRGLSISHILPLSEF